MATSERGGRLCISLIVTEPELITLQFVESVIYAVVIAANTNFAACIEYIYFAYKNCVCIVKNIRTNKPNRQNNDNFILSIWDI